MENYQKVKLAVCVLNMGIEQGQHELSIVARSIENKTISIYATIKNFKELFENPLKFIFDLQDYYNGEDSLFDEKLDDVLKDRALVTNIIMTYDGQFNVLDADSFNRELD